MYIDCQTPLNSRMLLTGASTPHTQTVLDAAPPASHPRAISIEIFGPAHHALLRNAGRVAPETLAHVGARLAPGVTTADIDRWVREDTARRSGTPSQLGYQGFPAAVCTRQNEVLCVTGYRASTW